MNKKKRKNDTNFYKKIQIFKLNLYGCSSYLSKAISKIWKIKLVFLATVL